MGDPGDDFETRIHTNVIRDATDSKGHGCTQITLAFDKPTTAVADLTAVTYLFLRWFKSTSDHTTPPGLPMPVESVHLASTLRNDQALAHAARLLLVSLADRSR